MTLLAAEYSAYRMDEIDHRILHALQHDGRLTNHDLAAKVGLSPSPCLRRVRALEATGTIARYVALLDPAAVGLPVTAFVRVRLTRQTETVLSKFEAAIIEFSEVMECYLMSGDSDYQLRVVVGSLSAFEDFIRRKLVQIDCVSQVTSSFALRPVVYRTDLPLTC